VEPAAGDALRQLEVYLRRQPPRNAPRGVEILSPGFDLASVFVPAGDGARSFYRTPVPAVTAEVRVRRDGLISSARDEVEMYIEPDERLWLRKPNQLDEVFVPVPEEDLSPGLKQGAMERVAVGYPSTVVGLTPAVMLAPPRLLASARGFLRFVDEAYGYLGYLGPIHVEARVSGGGSYYLAVPFPPEGAQRRYYRVSEQTELRSSIEVEHQDLAKREADLAQEMLTRLAWHFGLEDFGR
jgi:hypothetical protein